MAIGTRINIARRAAVARKIAPFTSRPSLCMCPLLLAPPSMPYNEAWRISRRALFTGVRGRLHPTSSPTKNDLPSTARQIHFGEPKGYADAQNAPEGSHEWVKIDFAERDIARGCRRAASPKSNVRIAGFSVVWLEAGASVVVVV